MRGFFGGIFALIATTMMLVNALGPIVSGIWLAILGEWQLIGVGIVYMIFGVVLISLLIAPGIAFVMGAGALAERGSRFGAVAASIPALLWTYSVAIGTCVLVLMYAVDAAQGADSYIPYLLWGYGVATAPWTYMALKEDQSGAGNGAASLTASFLVMGCGIAVLWFFFEGAETWRDWAFRIGVAMAVCLFWQVLEIFTLTRRRY